MRKIILFFIFLLVFSTFVFGVDITKTQGNSFFVDIKNDPIFLLDTNVTTQCSNDGSLIPLGNGSCVASADLGGSFVSFGTDNQKLLFGTEQDASIKYDGTNLVFTTDEVGSGLAYFSGNISTTGVITRTSVYDKKDGSALDKIKDATELTKDGEIDHKAFYGYVQQEVTDYSKPVNNTYVKCSKDDAGKEICQNVSEIIYPHTKIEDGVDLGKEIDVLRQAVYELKKINSELKTELCTFNDKYSWCKIGIIK
jgi:hypothetical protein